VPDEEVPAESGDSAVRDEGESPASPDEDRAAEARLRMPPWAPEVSFRKQLTDQPSNPAAAPGQMTWAWQGGAGAAKSRTGAQSSRVRRLGEFKYVGIMVIGACLFAAAGGFVVLSVLGGPRLPQDDAGATVMPGAYGMGRSQFASAATSSADRYSAPKSTHGATHAATPSRSAGSPASEVPAAAPNNPASSSAASAATSAAKTQAVTAPTSAAATAAAAVAETGIFTGYDALCLDDWARRTVDGNQIIIEGCIETSAQSWTVEPDGTMQVEGMCMDVPGSSPAVGSLVELWSCDGAATQVWRAGPDGTLVNSTLKLCLDDPDSDSSPGTGLDVAACTDGANQQWTFQAG
jgi:hypothetical protein